MAAKKESFSAREMEFKWSKETCRLDELESKFKLPCVVKINEGYYTASETNGFSQGDIIGIDQKMIQHNISAYVVQKNDADELAISNKEIQVPLNYNRKVKIVQRSKTYYSVQDLILDFPRYAEAGQDFAVIDDDNDTLVVHAGERIELERLIPGSNNEPDSLVIQFVHEGDPIEAKLCTTTKGVFKTLPDDNEYTLTDVVERLKLPQIVAFVDDYIHKVCTQDLVEGIANMVSISGRVQLNRLVTQTVFVGHLKSIRQPGNDTARFQKRTLIVLPLDHPGIRAVTVSVSQNYDDYDRIYESVFLVKNTSDDMQIIDTLYVEFKREFPNQRKATSENKIEDKKRKPKVAPKPTTRSQKPPPIAKRPIPVLPKDTETAQEIHGDALSKTPDMPPPRPPPVEWDKVDDNYYLMAQPPPIVRREQKTSSSSNEDYEEYDEFVQSLEIPEANANTKNDKDAHTSPNAETRKVVYRKKNPTEDSKGDVVVKEKTHSFTKSLSKLKDSENNSLLKFFRKGLTKAKAATVSKTTGLPLKRQMSEDTAFKEEALNDRGGTRSSAAMLRRSSFSDVEGISDVVYDDIDERNMLSDESIKKASRNRKSTGRGLEKQFNDLRCDELVNELNRVKLFDLAELCKKEQLDGKFFDMVSDEELKKAFGLKNADEFQRFKKLKSDR
ncbi:uncharacterized protein LOC128214745 isoform X2 [Mya arenaria]|uniref:uncharacterized protein LOC128214745 isoform X2 n=1 Tax=Mya arenaria TaxID=6604 RepID=UPI0022E83F3F|nr:uncharacterized protein LOC128214745 isoform X2 [Mya arenaria]